MTVRIGDVPFGESALGWIIGPCALESEAIVCQVAEEIIRLREKFGHQFVFKGSFDKANRTSADASRGPGLQEGLRLLELVKHQYDLPTITDVHETPQVEPVADVCDALQIPAFLCRQTDLITAAAATGKPVMIKRGQFLAPEDMALAADKATSAGDGGVLLAERGSSFGYRDLVVDFRALPIMREHAPVIFDMTHAVQKPGAAGGSSGGALAFSLPLARAAIAVGVDGIFLETHPDPSSAISDRLTQLPLANLASVVETLVDLHHRLTV